MEHLCDLSDCRADERNGMREGLSSVVLLVRSQLAKRQFVSTLLTGRVSARRRRGADAAARGEGEADAITAAAVANGNESSGIDILSSS